MRNSYFLVAGLLFSIFAHSQIINIPDASFKSKLVGSSPSNTVAKDLNGNYFAVDADADGEISVQEALSVSYFMPFNLNNGTYIQDITGIQYFTNLTGLNLQGQLITDINEIYQLHLLTLLSVPTTGVSSVSLSAFPDLNYFSCFGSGLSALDLSGVPHLSQLVCVGNNLTELDLSACPQLFDLDCRYNQITTLDIGHNPLLHNLNCSNNPFLEEINLKNGTGLFSFIISALPMVSHICTDDNETAAVQSQVNINNYTYCAVNSYCSFTPGGNYNVVQGQCNYDYDNNSTCSPSELIPSPVMFTIAGSTETAASYMNTGSFWLPLANGAYTITPALEHPSYFNVFPPSLSVAFPAQSSPLTSNFCITPNGEHKNLEVLLVPASRAIPGFDNKYKIIIKNNGTVNQSGSFTLHFNDGQMDFVESAPAADSQLQDYITWNYTDLLPLESRTITATFNLNTPFENLPVVAGEYIGLDATIYPIDLDEDDHDNHSDLKQLVMNSFDPNDKTCSEGEITGPAVAGEYVHYLIRFENTGTALAQHIVVKDMIDLTKFEIGTLIPITGSHAFETRITSGNKVEFIFQNINLPFDDDNNDGYVAFKIRAKPTLVAGDSFSNTASIYFDYNLPIITNTATTLIQELKSGERDFSDNFVLYPVPAVNRLYLKAVDGVTIQSVSVYNLIGQLLIKTQNFGNEGVDVSALASGSYLLRVEGSDGSFASAFIKQ
ncbi:MAG: T9SS type A sorting domain-containing protein [Flavobacterium sp.]|nr:MAG: T9SS type A sorting domain-containing protein [Flavobacterium sp.]